MIGTLRTIGSHEVAGETPAARWKIGFAFEIGFAFKIA